MIYKTKNNLHPILDKLISVLLLLLLLLDAQPTNQPHWSLKRVGLEISGQRLMSP